MHEYIHHKLFSGFETVDIWRTRHVTEELKRFDMMSL